MRQRGFWLVSAGTAPSSALQPWKGPALFLVLKWHYYTFSFSMVAVFWWGVLVGGWAWTCWHKLNYLLHNHQPISPYSLPAVNFTSISLSLACTCSKCFHYRKIYLNIFTDFYSKDRNLTWIHLFTQFSISIQSVMKCGSNLSACRSTSPLWISLQNPSVDAYRII